MKLKFLILLLLIIITSCIYSQELPKPAYSRFELLSNGISDIAIENDYIWLGTGKGLSLTTDKGNSFTTFGVQDNIGKGSVSAIGINEGIIWVATGFDTNTTSGKVDAGSGLSYSTDKGNTWVHLPQPVDPNKKDSLGYSPTTTHIQNVTYDIEFSDSTIWIASYGGGFRKSTDMGKTWEVVTPDNKQFDVLNNLNHRGFSIATYQDELWFGSADGINKSTDGGKSWTNYTAQNGSGISGNFVVAIEIQELLDRHLIWAATWKAETEGEYYAVSKSENSGLSWETSLEGEKVHNFGFDGNTVYAVSDNGLFKSVDFGNTWYEYPQITDETNIILTEEYYSVAVKDGELWVGTADGLAYSNNDGFTWNIFRAFVQPAIKGEPLSYAYPNPFSPYRHNILNDEGHLRIQFKVINTSRVTIDIYDFAMNHIRNIIREKYFDKGTYSETWNGRKESGEGVSNGVYFYKITFENTEEWGKIVVLN